MGWHRQVPSSLVPKIDGDENLRYVHYFGPCQRQKPWTTSIIACHRVACKVPLPFAATRLGDNLHGMLTRTSRFFLLLAGAIVASAHPQQAPPALPVFVDGQAQIVPAFQDQAQWIRQILWVETEFDSDGDGKHDRVFVDVTRPQQTETEGLKVPVIYESSPYFAGTSGDRQFLWDVKQEARRAAAAADVAAGDRVQAGPRERLELAGRRRGCRADSPSCTPTRRAPDCRRDARRSAARRSSSRRRPSSTG